MSKNKKITIEKKVILLSILIIFVFLIITNFLQQLQITQKVTLLDQSIELFLPESIFAFSRGAISLADFAYYDSFSRSKYYNFLAFFLDKSRFSSRVASSDTAFFISFLPIDQFFHSVYNLLSSAKCWFPCQVEWWRTRREVVIAQLHYLLGREVGSLVAAVSLGANDVLDPEVLDLFADLGLQHLLAPSGFHLGIFLLVLSTFVPMRLPRFLQICIPGMASFYLVVLTGFRPSLIRAWCMWLLSMLAWWLARRSLPPLVRLIVTVCLILLIWPEGGISVSFRLSVAATVGIILFAPLALSDRNFFLRAELGLRQHALSQVARWNSAFLEYTRGTIVIGLIAQISVAPLILDTFGEIQLFAPISTVFLAWFFPLLLFFGVVIVLFSPVFAVFPGLAQVIFYPIRFSLELIWQVELLLLTWLQAVLPSSFVWKAVPDWFSVVWWGVLVLFRIIWWVGEQQSRKKVRQLV
ncbi:MAG: ComEC/Rec2 family competence protein [Candidatus Pacebacteria bacterium]|nr:ComEC/Rec2 family competence protein [Candidatus Paceibacterota bacterium]